MDDVYAPPFGDESASTGPSLGTLAAPILQRWKTVLGAGLLVGVLGFGASYAIPNRYTASCVFLPPQNQPGGAAGALASLGSLSGLIGAGAAKNSPDQYVGLMGSATVADRIVGKFDLRKLFDVRYEVDARKRLAQRTVITVGKKDGLISVAYTDIDPARAAAIANQYVEELRTMTNSLAVTEAQQRRVFFEQLLGQTRDRLAAAQKALEATGINAGAINTEPRSAADAYSRVRAESTAAQVRLQVLRSTLADTAPEVRQQQGLVDALRSQLDKLEAQNHGDGSSSGDYVDRYREFKYQEMLLDLFARQYESARVDESREGTLIQVVDRATPPERKSGPSHMVHGLVWTAIGLVLAASWFLVRARRTREPS
jgi:uncharacterized protein involved in exopolysaccharide biosynthesis